VQFFDVVAPDGKPKRDRMRLPIVINSGPNRLLSSRQQIYDLSLSGYPL
jgi:hypothetical protein